MLCTAGGNYTSTAIRCEDLLPSDMKYISLVHDHWVYEHYIFGYMIVLF